MRVTYRLLGVFLLGWACPLVSVEAQGFEEDFGSLQKWNNPIIGDVEVQAGGGPSGNDCVRLRSSGTSAATMDRSVAPFQEGTIKFRYRSSSPSNADGPFAFVALLAFADAGQGLSEVPPRQYRVLSPTEGEAWVDVTFPVENSRDDLVAVALRFGVGDGSQPETQGGEATLEIADLVFEATR